MKAGVQYEASPVSGTAEGLLGVSARAFESRQPVHYDCDVPVKQK